MSFCNEVDPRFFQELRIDTDIEYQFPDNTFPGLNDPRYMYEPILLVGSNKMDDNVHKVTEPACLRYPSTDSCYGSPVAMTEEDIISFIGKLTFFHFLNM